MPKLPRNMIRRRGRPGFYYRRRGGGRELLISLGTNYQEACGRLRSLKSDEDFPRGPEITVREAARRWLATYVATARREQDRKLAAQRVRDFLEPCLGHLLLRRLTADHLRIYRLRLERSHLSLQSVRHVLSDLRCLLNWCEDSGLIDRSPVPRKLLPRIQERPPDRLTDEEVEQVRAVPEPYAFIVRLGLGTGLRWGEMVRATAADLQSEALVVHQTKSGKVRRVPLPPELRAELRSRVGRLFSITDPQGFAEQVRKHSGVERFHAHQLRHTFACHWLEQGGSLAALQEILGHSSIVTTQRYARLSEAHVRAEVERLGGRRGYKEGYMQG